MQGNCRGVSVKKKKKKEGDFRITLRGREGIEVDYSLLFFPGRQQGHKKKKDDKGVSNPSRRLETRAEKKEGDRNEKKQHTEE